MTEQEWVAQYEKGKICRVELLDKLSHLCWMTPTQTPAVLSMLRSRCDLEIYNVARWLTELRREPWLDVSADPAWLTPTVISLAQAIDAERAFDRLPILADALEDAGCTNADMLNHCRQPGEHVRGCWAVDLVLQKK
jgi:hypothetical protein